jgi:heme-degrading monooxygenase HmoA
MPTSFVLHRVADYDAWRAVYDGVADVQRAGGVTDQAVYRAAGDPDNVLVMHRFSSLGEAQAFFDSPELRQAMERAGVDEASLRVELYEEA